MVYSLGHDKTTKLTLTADGRTYYGAYQEWYPTLFRRMAGCGPTAAANMLACVDDRLPFASVEARVKVMQSLWRYVTPGVRGLHRVEKFARGSKAFFKAFGLPFDCVWTEYTRDAPLSQKEMADFIKQGLTAGSPLAFLNLRNDTVPCLEKWHWVTVVAFDDETLTADVFDGDIRFELPLEKWYRGGKEHSGLAYYKK